MVGIYNPGEPGGGRVSGPEGGDSPPQLLFSGLPSSLGARPRLTEYIYYFGPHLAGDALDNDTSPARLGRVDKDLKCA